MRDVLLIAIIGFLVSNPQCGWAADATVPATEPAPSPLAVRPTEAGAPDALLRFTKQSEALGVAAGRAFAHPAFRPASFALLRVAKQSVRSYRSAERPGGLRPAAQDTVLLPDLIEEALRRSPQVLAAKSRWEAARARIAQAWGLKRPWASYGFVGSEVQTRSGPQEHVFGFSQEIPFPTKLPMRSRAAKLVARRAEHHVLHVEQRVRTEVVAAYAELLWAQQALEVLKTEHGTLEQISATVQAQYATGGRSAADAAKIEAEIARLAERTLVTDERRVAAEEQLRVLLDQPRMAPWPLLMAPPTPELPFTREELIQLALKYRHSLVIAKLTAKEQQTQYRLAKMEYLPDIEVGFSYTEIGGGTTTRPDDGDNAWMIPIRISLPFWEPQIRGQVREARANKEAAEQDLEHAENLAYAEVVDRYTRYRTARERIGVYAATWLPQAEQALASTQAAYEAGRGTVLDVLDSERMVLEAKLGYWQSLADTLSAYAALEQAVGIPFETVGHAEQEG